MVALFQEPRITSVRNALIASAFGTIWKVFPLKHHPTLLRMLTLRALMWYVPLLFYHIAAINMFCSPLQSQALFLEQSLIRMSLRTSLVKMSLIILSPISQHTSKQLMDLNQQHNLF